MGNNRGHIPELDGVRAIAVLMVLLAHWPIASQRLAYPFGGLGVSIFFTLSGFLITRILLFNRDSGIGIRHFWTTRAARIFPLSVAVLLAIGVCVGFDAEWWQCLTFTYNLMLTPTYNHNPALAPFWSLCVEEQFYLLWPLVVLFGGPRMARNTAWSLIVASAVFVAALPAVAALGMVSADRLLVVAHAHTLSRVAAIAAGCLLAIHEPTIRQSPRSVMLAAAAVLAITLSAGTVLMQAASLIVDPDIAFPTMAVATRAGSVYHQTGVGIAINIAAIVAAIHTPQIVGVLRVQFAQWLGRVSYCVYLIHLPIWWAVGAREPEAGTMLAVAGLLVVLVTAELSRRYFEQPIRDWARTLTRQTPPRAHAEHEHAQQHDRDGQAAGVAP